jgi:hypothetical protein
MDLQIVNPDRRYQPVALLEPRPFGYLHVAAEVSPPRRPGPIVRRGRARSRLLARLDPLARELERVAAVVKVTVYEAVVIPPFGRFPYVKERASEVRFPRFDVVVLVETISPEAVREVQATPSYRALLEELHANARRVHVLAARNTKRLDDVDRSRQGLFLFNYFVAEDAGVALQLWDHLARWFEVETGLDNSMVLVPLEGESSDYVFINHARLDRSPPRLWLQFAKKSFRSFVLANAEQNHVGPMPVLYRLATPARRRSARRALPKLFGAAALGLGAYAANALRRGGARRKWRWA